jgi:hypothetical protein
MSRNYKFHDQERPYFVAFSVIRWIDVFTRTEYKDIIVDSLKYCKVGAPGCFGFSNGKERSIQVMRNISFGSRAIILSNLEQ